MKLTQIRNATNRLEYAGTTFFDRSMAGTKAHAVFCGYTRNALSYS